MTEKRSSNTASTSSGLPERERSLAPIGTLGFRGRRATPEERSRILDAYFFEGDRRIPFLQQYLVLMLLSAIIAGFGLANDSAAVVIGAMLVAPLMTPILALAAALVQGWAGRMLESAAIVALGALVAIGVGFVLAYISPVLRADLTLPGELLARTHPNLADLMIALAAGAAGGFVAVRTEASGALPGVGIAVALVPPLAAVGLTAGLGAWDLAAGALLLFLTNLVAIVLAAGLVFVGAGFAAFSDAKGLAASKAAAAVVGVGVVIVGIPLAIHSVQRIEQESAIAAVAGHVRVWAPDLTLEGVRIDRSADPILVEVGVTGRTALPDPAALAALLAEELGELVDVDVLYAPVVRGSTSVP